MVVELFVTEDREFQTAGAVSSVEHSSINFEIEAGILLCHHLKSKKRRNERQIHTETEQQKKTLYEIGYKGTSHVQCSQDAADSSHLSSKKP